MLKLTPIRFSLCAACVAVSLAAFTAIAPADTCGGGTDYSFPCGTEGQAASTALYAQGQAAASTRDLLTQISNPAVKATVTAVLNLSNSLASQANTLLQKAVSLQASNPALAAQFTKAAAASALAASALAEAAQATAVAVLHVQKAAQHAVSNQLGISKFYAAKAAALIRQAQAILSGGGASSDRSGHAAAAHVTPAQRRKAQQLINKATADSAKSTLASRAAQQIVASRANPPGRIGAINRSVRKIVASYSTTVVQTRRLEAGIKSSGVRRSINGLLRRAGDQVSLAKTRQGWAVVNALAKTQLKAALKQILEAQKKARRGRELALSAHAIAAHALR